MSPKILIINPFGIGDVLFSTALVSTLKKIYPNSYIGYICNIRTKELLETNPEVNEVFVFERDQYRNLWKRAKIESMKKFFKFWRDISKKKFDIAIDLSLGKEYAFLCWLVGIKERRGFNYRGRGRFLTNRVPFDGFNEKSVTEYYLAVLQPCRLPLAACRVDTVLIFTKADELYIDNLLKDYGLTGEDILVGIAPGGGISFGKKDQERRRWHLEKFAQLADRLIEKFNVRIILIWGPEEEDLVKKISSLMAHKPLIAPKTTIREMAALCKRCNIVICSEGGPLHIAASQGVKTISIFGPVDERVYGPYPPGKNNVIITSGLKCRPCYKRFKLPECNSKKCLEEISVDTVFEAVCNFFDRINGIKQD